VQRYLVLVALVALVALGACAKESTPAKWESLETAYAASFLGVWGSSTTDVWVSGADARDLGDGLGPAVFHYDGSAWTRLDTGLRKVDLWWVFGFENGPVFFGGSGGTLLRYQNGTFEKLTTPGVSIVFGIWGNSPTDVWMVGGQFAATGFVWHFDGSTVRDVPIPTELSMSAVWKVAGLAGNDIWMSCSFGAVLHWDGQNLVRENVGGSNELLFSIGATSQTVVAVGSNQTNGRLYERVAGAWMDKTINPTDPPWRGVSATASGVYAVGENATVAHRTDSGWSSETAVGTVESFHADWVDPDGGLWGVGGKFNRIPPTDGMILHKGTTSIAPLGL
jgi:hypothetical protein